MFLHHRLSQRKVQEKIIQFYRQLLRMESTSSGAPRKMGCPTSMVGIQFATISTLPFGVKELPYGDIYFRLIGV